MTSVGWSQLVISLRSRRDPAARPEGVSLHRQALPTCAGLLIGGTVVTLHHLMAGLAPSLIFFRGVLGALACGSVGFAAGTWLRSAASRRAVASPVDLYDPWIDRRRSGLGGFEGSREDEGDPGLEITPERAIVRPRVLASRGETSFCLEDEILPLVQRDERGAIWIQATTGSGKSTALRHLAAVLPPELGVCFLDEPDEATLVERSAGGIAVYTAPKSNHPKVMARFILAPWGIDERIEYLLGKDKGRCGSVMARLKEAGDSGSIGGNPELWSVVLDRMIADDSLVDVRTALRQELAPILAEHVVPRRLIESWPEASEFPPGFPVSLEEEIELRFHHPKLVRMVRHDVVRLLLAADRIVGTLLESGASCGFLGSRLPRDVVREAGHLLADRPEAVVRLLAVLEGSCVRDNPTAASLLHASGIGWKPDSDKVVAFPKAYLDRASWPGIKLAGSDLSGAEMDLSDLSGADLDRVDLKGALLRRSNLRGASLLGGDAQSTDLAESNLSLLRAEGVNFSYANLEKADLDSAHLRNAWFHGANLKGARFVGANLTGSELDDAKIEGADFSGAIFQKARLGGLTLSNANFAGARFTEADLLGCNLEGMKLPKADFREANLQKALLTGSNMPGADFRGADLREAGLGLVAWQNVCLAGADLRGVSFHLGSSRSGLVFSTTPCEGSRTGFYTDDLLEQDFKAPEEIRKADLRGADLRGAKIEGVDFYLVDLRGAVIDPEQGEQLLRSGAILVDRV